jgi:ubiquinone/menaquinone biosynthesis C-methylase UbiE
MLVVPASSANLTYTRVSVLPTDKSLQSEKLLGQAGIHTQWESNYLNPDLDRFYDLAFADIVRTVGAKPGSTILDAGCGYAYHTVRLARSGASITAVDFSEAALRIAGQTLAKAGIEKTVELQQADLTALPFADNSFDFVVSWGVLMHIPELEAALTQLARVLKPGGVLVLCENNARSLDVVIREPVVDFLKGLLGRQRSSIQRTARGVEAWTEGKEGGLMVRKTDLNFLRAFLAKLGLREVARRAGQFTEAYTNLRPRWARRFVYWVNMTYYQFLKWPAPAMGNIMFFRKS